MPQLISLSSKPLPNYSADQAFINPARVMLAAAAEPVRDTGWKRYPRSHDHLNVWSTLRQSWSLEVLLEWWSMISLITLREEPYLSGCLSVSGNVARMCRARGIKVVRVARLVMWSNKMVGRPLKRCHDNRNNHGAPLPFVNIFFSSHQHPF